MQKLPKINQLKNLRAIINCGSIRLAALTTHQTQSAMSRSIQELEQTIGSPLLIRRTSGIQLTDIGKILEPKMNLILNELERTVDEVKQILNHSNGEVTFGCSHLPAAGIMVDIIKKFQARYPLTQLTIVEGQFPELASSVRMGRLDFFVGIVSPEISLADLRDEHLCKVRFHVVARKEHHLIKSKSLVDLRNGKWFLPGKNSSIFNSIEKIIFPKGKGQQCSVLYGDSVMVALQLIMNCDCLSIAPYEIIESPFVKENLAFFELEEDLPFGFYSIVRRKDTVSTKVTQWLIDEVRREFKCFSSNINHIS